MRVVKTPQLEGLTDWRPLARGGFAVVWEARQESLDRLVAVKIITRKLDNVEERERFLRESSAAGRMSSHPGIVTVHDAGLLEDDRPYLVMELCTGGSLTRRLDPANRPSEEWVRDLGVRIADALDAAHSQGVLHRDVKPANVLIDQYGRAGLADFGLAILTDPGMELDETLEALTPAYAPPEAFQPHSPTKSGDVYSLAATLYALLSGHAPRAVDPSVADPDMTAAQVVMAHLDDPIDRLPDVDTDLMDVLMQALDDEPTNRPSAAEFRDALAALPLGVPSAALLPELDEPVTPVAPAADAVAGGTGAEAGAAARVPANPPSAGPGAAASGPRPVWKRWPILVAAAVLALVLIALAVGLGRGGGPAAGSTPTAGTTVPPASTPTSTSASPSSSTTLLPGFVDCSKTVGQPAQCGPTPPQCWGGVISNADSPYLATEAKCTSNHVYQTFAAGPLDRSVNRQSQLDGDPRVKATCTRALVNAMVPADQRRDDWEVFAIPAQSAADGEGYFRCIFGKGQRSAPITLTPPG